MDSSWYRAVRSAERPKRPKPWAEFARTTASASPRETVRLSTANRSMVEVNRANRSGVRKVLIGVPSARAAARRAGTDPDWSRSARKGTTWSS